MGERNGRRLALLEVAVVAPVVAVATEARLVMLVERAHSLHVRAVAAVTPRAVVLAMAVGATKIVLVNVLPMPEEHLRGRVPLSFRAVHFQVRLRNGWVHLAHDIVGRRRPDRGRLTRHPGL